MIEKRHFNIFASLSLRHTPTLLSHYFDSQAPLTPYAAFLAIAARLMLLIFLHSDAMPGRGPPDADIRHISDTRYWPR